MGDMSGSKSSSSSSSNTTNTTNIDRRQVMSDGAIGVTSDSSTINIESMDAGVVNKALDVVASNDTIAGQGFTQLLILADKMFNAGGTILQKTADTTMAQVGALTTAQNDAKGAIDQKTMMILAGVAAAAFIASKQK